MANRDWQQNTPERTFTTWAVIRHICFTGVWGADGHRLTAETDWLGCKYRKQRVTYRQPCRLPWWGPSGTHCGTRTCTLLSGLYRSGYRSQGSDIHLYLWRETGSWHLSESFFYCQVGLHLPGIVYGALVRTINILSAFTNLGYCVKFMYTQFLSTMQCCVQCVTAFNVKMPLLALIFLLRIDRYVISVHPRASRSFD